ncbi:uncharacterized protein DC041_0009174 [Schistosoma bovis]|uniref:Tropomyosin 1 n=1 Tax=Schistosoma bovis TaxID=6184 RepID=A0A430Q6B7_SCHBO|nr:uncharacterized protein DC041_0009174 [Schistosoma bovis]
MVSVNMISAKLSDLHDNIAKLSHELDLKRKEKESQRSFVKKLDSEIKDKHRFLDSLEQKREQHEKTIRVNTERLCELQKSAAECQKAHESLEKRLESQEQSIRSLEDEVNEAQSLAKSSAHVYDEVFIANKRIEMLEEKIRELTEQINSATQRAVRAEEESENLAGELTILEDEANEWNEKSSNVQEQINMVRITISEA